MGRPNNTPNHDVMEVYQFIKSFIHQNKYAPSLREIVSGTSLSSTSSAATYVDILVEEGYLIKIDNIARGIILSNKRG